MLTSCYAGLVAACAAAISPTVSPPSFPAQVTVAATMNQPPVTAVQIGTARVVMESSTLGSIRHILGAGSISLSGQSGESKAWLCYSVINSGGAMQRVWLIADGEMGGQERRITAIVSEMSSDPASPSCPQIHGSLSYLSGDNSISSDTSEQQIRQILGQASGSRDGWTVFHYAGQVTPAPGATEPGKQNILLEIQIVSGRASRLRIRAPRRCDLRRR